MLLKNKNLSVLFVILWTSLIFVEARTVVSKSVDFGPMDFVKGQFGIREGDLQGFVSNKDGNVGTFGRMLLDGAKRETWNPVATQLGRSLIELHTKTALGTVVTEKREAITNYFTNKSVLLSWLETSNPESVPQNVTSRALQMLSEQQCVVHSDFSLDNVLAPDWRIVITPTVGAGIGDVATVLGDVIVRYHESVARRTLEPIADEDRVCDVQLSNMAVAFGQAYENGMSLTEEKKKEFWRDVAPLVGLDVMRRCEQLDSTSYQKQSQFGVTDCIQAANRILYNKRIDNVPFMFFVGLAMG